MTFCTSCRHQHASRFCTRCGTPAPAPDPATADVLPQPVQQEPPAWPQSAVPGAPWAGADRAGADRAGGRAFEPDPRRDRTVPLLAALTVLLLLVAAGAYVVWRGGRTQTVVAPANAASTASATGSAGPSIGSSPGAAADPSTPPTPSTERTESTEPTPSTQPSRSERVEPAPPLPPPAPVPPRAPPPRSTSAPVPPPAAGAPYGTPFEVVVLASTSPAEGGRPAAEALVDDIRAAGYPAMVFASEGYTSLRCCYWVAAAGPFPSAAAAQSAATVLRGRSPLFSTAYERCVGAAYQCPS